MSGIHGIGCEPVLPRHRRERRRGARQAVIGGLACSFLILSITGCVAPTSSAQQTTPGSAAPSAATPTPQATATQVPTPTPAPTASPTPTSGFSLTGSMAVGRTRHTATLLQDGRVLIVGGSSKAWSSPSLASAELYDPATGTFSRTGSMHVGRAGHTATLLQDGRVLITGGHTTDLGGTWVQAGSRFPDMGVPLASAELYDPATGTFTATGSMIAARDSHGAALLSDGRVLVVGGFDCSPSVCDNLRSAELYNPATGKFTATGAVEECGGRTAALADGRVLVVSDCQGLEQVYNPATGKFGGAAIAGPSNGGGIARLADGRVLLTGGYVFIPGAKNSLVATAQLYDPATAKLAATGSPVKARASHSMTLLSDGRVLMAGGGDPLACRAKSCASSASNSTELYDPATGKFVSGQSMNAGRFDHSATLLQDGRVLIVGGHSGSKTGSTYASAELYQP